MVHPRLEGQLILSIEKPCLWVIESPEEFSEYTQELFRQSEGAEGRFVLSEDEKEIDISKNVEVIFNPYAVNINDRKILNKLHAELSEQAAGEEMYIRTQEIKNNLLAYFMELEHASPYILETDEELDMTAIFKAIGVRFGDYANDFVENLNQYIKIMAELMYKKVVVLINIGSYLSEKQLEQIIQNAIYNEIALMMVENAQRELKGRANQYIIDKDRCEIF